MPAGGGVDKLTAANIEDLWDIVKEQVRSDSKCDIAHNKSTTVERFFLCEGAQFYRSKRGGR